MSVDRADRAWYALRRTLPAWSFERNLVELEECVSRYRVNEVVIKLDTEDFWHGQPTVDWARGCLPRLFEIKTRLSRLGVVYSLNPWVTLGHCDRGRDDRERLPGFEGLVGHDGQTCRACACPLSEVWRKNITEVWSIYAETAPTVMWIEDDIRNFNHEPVKYSCFCPLHLEAFSRRVGETVTREQIVSAILQPGSPHPWRIQYLEMQGEITTEVLSRLTRAVHEVSPQTSMGLMSSGPRQHCLEGRDWRQVEKVLSETTPLYSRPPMANYWEERLTGFYYAQDSIKLTRYCFSDRVIEQTEVENFPFTRYSKSVAVTFLQMAVSFAYGSHGVTLNLFDHCGTPMEDEPWYGAMLANKKNFLESLAEKAQGAGVFRGVQLMHRDKASFNRQLAPGASYRDLAEDGVQMMELLESCGIPTTYDSSTVFAASGQQLRSLSDAEIHSILSGGLFLDGVAAAVLFERGFGDSIGLREICPATCVDDIETLAAEEFHNQSFGGRDGVFMSLTLPGFEGRPAICPVDLVAETQVISTFVDPDTIKKCPAMYAFENSFGGRIIVHLYSLSSAFGVPFLNSHRRRQYQAAIRWLFRGSMPLLIIDRVHPLSFRKDSSRSSLLGFFDLTLDRSSNIAFELNDDRQIIDIKLLAGESWQDPPALEVQRRGGHIKCNLDCDFSFDEPVFIEILWEAGSELKKLSI